MSDSENELLLLRMDRGKPTTENVLREIDDEKTEGREVRESSMQVENRDWALEAESAT